MRTQADVETYLGAWPEAMLRPMLRCARGEIAPNVALMQLLIEVQAPTVEQALSEALALCRDRNDDSPQRLTDALDLLRRTARAGEIVQSIMAHADHSCGPVSHDVAVHWSRTFDEAVRISPEASVALYTLGSSALLNAATAEVVDLMEMWGLLSPEYNVLEIGCGIGRFLQALSSRVRTVIGVDVSYEMLRIARERSRASNASCILTSGHDLSAFRSAAFEIVIAIDVFPYFQASNVLLGRHLQDARRVLKPQGRLFIVNFSYRADDALDRNDLRRLGSVNGFCIVQNGERPFASWDGLAFLLQRTD